MHSKDYKGTNVILSSLKWAFSYNDILTSAICFFCFSNSNPFNSKVFVIFLIAGTSPFSKEAIIIM